MLLALLSPFLLTVHCGGPSGQADTADDGDAADADGADAPEPATCEVVRAGEAIAPLPCRSDMCFRPHLSLGGRSEGFLVAYSKNVGWWTTDVVARLLDADGSTIGTEISVSGRTDPPRSTTQPWGSSEHPVVIPWNDRWLVAWDDRLTGNVFIAAAALDVSGSSVWTGSRWTGPAGSFTWLGVVDVAPAAPSWEDLASQAAVTATDAGAMLAWSAQGPTHNGGQSVTLGLLPDSGMRRGPDLDVSSSAARGTSASTVAVSADGVLVAWEDRRDTDLDGDGTADPDVGIWARLVENGLTGFRTDEFPVAPARYESSRPAAIRADDAFLVVWQDYRTGNFEIFAARVGPDGSVDPPQGTRVSDTPGPSRNPALARSDDGAIILVWQEAPAAADTAGTGFDIVLSRSVDGGRTWQPPVLVAADAGSSPGPDVAVAGTRIGVAWIQDRPPEFEARFALVACP